MKEIQNLTGPCYIMEEAKLRSNLALIRSVMEKADVDIILAFKAFSLWKSFPIFREYINSTTASSYNEARMAFECFGEKAHTYSPAYEEETFLDILRFSSHLTFNSLPQYNRFHSMVKDFEQKTKEHISLGLRINPEYSEIQTDLYNPCAKGSRFGILEKDMPDTLPTDIEGLHVHIHCESDSYALERSWQHIASHFSKWINQVKWLNLGGGHLMTRKDYNVNHLISILKNIHKDFPNLKIILEPGSAFAWQTGFLQAQVVDIVSNHDIKTAILNVSFTCHMPDCLEMPYQPQVRNARQLTTEEDQTKCTDKQVYRLGGNSCLSGDFMGYWYFDHELQIGETLIFEDMIHYTTVKTNMFNGVSHPSIAIKHVDGRMEIYKKFEYKDYLERMC